MIEFDFAGVDPSSEELKSTGGISGEFGLNTGCTVTKYEYNPNAGKDGAPSDAIDISVDIKGKEFKRRLYDVTRVYDVDGNQLTDKTDENFVKRYKIQTKMLAAVCKHVAEAVGVEKHAMNNSLSQVSNFVDFAKTMESLVKPKLNNNLVDVFLEYQWTIPKGEDKTYLELPKNMKGGYFMVKSVKPVGKWKEVIEDDNLKYVDESGNEHPFKRDAGFMTNNKAIRQFKNSSSANNVVPSSSVSSGGSSSSSDAWD